jgi:hypothetical protein
MAKKAATTVVEDEDEDVEVEDTEEADAEVETIWGVQDLIKLVKTKTGKDYKPREVRTQLRAMARRGEIDREIIPGNKQRYSWSGPDDAEVKAFIKAVKGGEIEKNKKAALDKLKSDKAKKNAAKSKATPATSKKGKPAPEPDEDDEEE